MYAFVNGGSLGRFEGIVRVVKLTTNEGLQKAKSRFILSAKRNFVYVILPHPVPLLLGVEHFILNVTILFFWMRVQYENVSLFSCRAGTTVNHAFPLSSVWRATTLCGWDYSGFSSVSARSPVCWFSNFSHSLNCIHCRSLGCGWRISSEIQETPVSIRSPSFFEQETVVCLFIISLACWCCCLQSRCPCARLWVSRFLHICCVSNCRLFWNFELLAGFECRAIALIWAFVASKILGVLRWERLVWNSVAKKG